jgi:hypothetical protein
MTNNQLPARRVPTRVTQPHHPYPTPLPPQTMVQRKTDGNIGEVQHYHPTALPARLGTFPVQWHGGQWTICGSGDVTPLITPQPTKK